MWDKESIEFEQKMIIMFTNASFQSLELEGKLDTDNILNIYMNLRGPWDSTGAD